MPNTSHRIKLVIADVTDDKVDSGLFIRESTVRSIPNHEPDHEIIALFANVHRDFRAVPSTCGNIASG
ncbi:MAG: hypothetical protein Q7R22_005750 [Verrucomicrobiota bacterium JB025]